MRSSGIRTLFVAAALVGATGLGPLLPSTALAQASGLFTGDEEEEGLAVPAEETSPEPTTDVVATSSPTPAETFRVYLVSVPIDDGLEAVSQRAGAQGRAALRTIAGAEWQSADQRFLGYEATANEHLQSARAHLQAGRDAYLALELDGAVRELSAAVADFDAAAVALEDPADLGQALLLLGASYGFQNRSREATRTFARLHVQMPHISPDPNEFPPDVVSRYEAARPRDAGNPRGVIHVESDPPGAVAFVGFIARGTTPIDVDRVLAGDHMVRTTRVGGTPAVQAVTVRGTRPVSVSSMLFDDANAAGLGEAIEGVRTASPEALPADHPLRAVASILDVERIAVLRTSRGESDDQVHLDLVVWDIETGRRLVRGAGDANVAVGQFESSVQELVSGALTRAFAIPRGPARPREVAPSEELPPIIARREQSSGPSIFEEPVFWAVVGGVVLVGAGVAVGVAVASDSGGQQGGQVILSF